MKKYRAIDHAKLSTAKERNDFTKFMIREYAAYVSATNGEGITCLVAEPERAIFDAHNDGDFDWFVAEFFKDQKHLKPIK